MLMYLILKIYLHEVHLILYYVWEAIQNFERFIA
jgi:hypothetical protein